MTFIFHFQIIVFKILQTSEFVLVFRSQEHLTYLDKTLLNIQKRKKTWLIPAMNYRQTVIITDKRFHLFELILLLVLHLSI